MMMDFEKMFPQSKVLPDIFLMAIDVYRQKGDRNKIIEYGEKTLKTDQNNVTAMMTLSRNYAIEKQNLDRAVMLAQQAVEVVGRMKTQAVPAQYSDSQWKSYLQSTEESARRILEYAKSMRGH